MHVNKPISCCDAKQSVQLVTRSPAVQWNLQSTLCFAVTFGPLGRAGLPYPKGILPYLKGRDVPLNRISFSNKNLGQGIINENCI